MQEQLVLPIPTDDDPAPLPPFDQPQQARTETNGQRFLENVRTPELTVYFPNLSASKGSAVLIAPGGGYFGVSLDKEGHDIAAWLARLGMTAGVLQYRMPRFDAPFNAAYKDALAAIRLFHDHAAEWGLDPRRLGMVGFSAGGHLAATVATHTAIEQGQSALAFLVLVYPVVTMLAADSHPRTRENLLGKSPTRKQVHYYSAEENVTSVCPPTLLVHAKDDHVLPKNSIAYHQACQAAGVPSELLLLESGGHGFGLGVNGGEPATWPGRCEQWLREQALI